jgi:hypothetical protein
MQGDNTSALNDYSPTNDCTGYAAQGRDVVYYMDLQEYDTVDMTYTQLQDDGSFYILRDCADMNSCVVGADETISGQVEHFSYTVLEAGRYYLILDAYGSDIGGPWTLDYIIECPGPPESGACCYGDEECAELLEEECWAMPQDYLWIAGETCDPNPCPPVSIEAHSWGGIKAGYR